MPAALLDAHLAQCGVCRYLTGDIGHIELSAFRVTRRCRRARGRARRVHDHVVAL